VVWDLFSELARGLCPCIVLLPLAPLPVGALLDVGREFFTPKPLDLARMCIIFGAQSWASWLSPCKRPSVEAAEEKAAL